MFQGITYSTQHSFHSPFSSFFLSSVLPLVFPPLFPILIPFLSLFPLSLPPAPILLSLLSSRVYLLLPSFSSSSFPLHSPFSPSFAIISSVPFCFYPLLSSFLFSLSSSATPSSPSPSSFFTSTLSLPSFPLPLYHPHCSVDHPFSVVSICYSLPSLFPLSPPAPPPDNMCGFHYLVSHESQ